MKFSTTKIHQNRLRLLASLLRAIEESNGGTLSHLQDSQEDDDAPQQAPSNNNDAGIRHVGFILVWSNFLLS